MRIGIVGYGMVGGAIAYGFNRVGHEISKYDPYKFPGSTIQNVLGTDVCFICVPTPPGPNGACNTTVVDEAVGALSLCEYKGAAVIKSTVTPGTTDNLQRHHPNLRLAFCPEFLRERATLADFVDNHEVCVIGTHSGIDSAAIIQAHGGLPRHFAVMKPIEAELTKYFCNVLNALRIVYANEFYDACEKVGADYQVIKQAVSKRSSIGTYYLDCAKNFRGYGGNCLPKDTSAFATFVQKLGLDTQLYDAIMEINERHT